VTDFQQHGFKMFLGVAAQIRNWNSEGNEFTIALEENPLTDFVELPNEYKDLWYSNIQCGVIRGALEMVWNTYSAPFGQSVLFNMFQSRRSK